MNSGGTFRRQGREYKWYQNKLAEALSLALHRWIVSDLGAFLLVVFDSNLFSSSSDSDPACLPGIPDGTVGKLDTNSLDDYRWIRHRHRLRNGAGTHHWMVKKYL